MRDHTLPHLSFLQESNPWLFCFRSTLCLLSHETEVRFGLTNWIRRWQLLRGAVLVRGQIAAAFLSQESEKRLRLTPVIRVGTLHLSAVPRGPVTTRAACSCDTHREMMVARRRGTPDSLLWKRRQTLSCISIILSHFQSTYLPADCAPNLALLIPNQSLVKG